MAVYECNGEGWIYVHCGNRFVSQAETFNVRKCKKGNCILYIWEQLSSVSNSSVDRESINYQVFILQILMCGNDIWQLAPRAPERIAAIFPSNIDLIISTTTKLLSRDKPVPSCFRIDHIFHKVLDIIFTLLRSTKKNGPLREWRIGRVISPNDCVRFRMDGDRLITKWNEALSARVGVLLVIDIIQPESSRSLAILNVNGNSSLAGRSIVDNILSKICWTWRKYEVRIAVVGLDQWCYTSINYARSGIIVTYLA